VQLGHVFDLAVLPEAEPLFNALRASVSTPFVEHCRAIPIIVVSMLRMASKC
jgi:hypothetical protein